MVYRCADRGRVAMELTEYPGLVAVAASLKGPEQGAVTRT